MACRRWRTTLLGLMTLGVCLLWVAPATAGAAPSGAQFAFSSDPVAPDGSLAAGRSVTIDLSVLDASGSPLPGGEAFVSLEAATLGGTAAVGSTDLTSTPAAFTADGSGDIPITYTAPTSTAQANGVDTLYAAGTAAGATGSGEVVGQTAIDAYHFAAPVLAGGGFVWNPSPLAADHSLASGDTVHATVTAHDAGGAAIPHALIYLSLSDTANGGGGVGFASAGSLDLGSSPQPFTADANGQIAVSYQAYRPLPGTRPVDLLTAQNTLSFPTAHGTTQYAYYRVPMITTQSLPDGLPGTPYQANLAASNGTPPYTWSLVGGSLPPGLELAADTGDISGTPTATGVYGFVVGATDTAGMTVQASYTLPVAEAWVSSMQPTSGPPGTKLALVGRDFGTVAGSVYFRQGAGAPIVAPPVNGSWSDTGAQVLVPSVLTAGTVTVAVYNGETGEVGSTLPFTVTSAPPPPPPPTSTGSIVVHVVAPAALNGIRLLAWSPSTGSGALAALAAPGSYTLSGLAPAKDFSLRILASDGRTLADQGPVTVGLAQPATATLNPALPATLSVQVTDPSGHPVPGVDVTLADAASQAYVAVGETDAKGSLASLDALQSLLSNRTLLATVSVGQRYYQDGIQQSIALQPGANALHLVLQPLPLGTVAGTVTGGMDGTPEAGATATVTENVYGGRTFVLTATTDANGRYSLQAPAGPAQIQVGTGGVCVSSWARIRITAGQTLAQDPLVGCPGSGHVTVRLFTQYLGQPLQGPLPVDWRVAVHFQLTASDAEGFSDWDYPLAITGYPGETVHVCADGTQAGLPTACADAKLDAQSNASVQLVLRQQGVIAGELVDGSTGQPITGAWSGHLYSLDASGSKTLVRVVGGTAAPFSLDVPAAGSYAVDFRQGQGSALRTGSVRATVAVSQEADVGRVDLIGSGAFADQPGDGVTAEPATAVPGQVVTIRATYRNGGTSAADGTVALLDVPGGTTLVPDSVVVNGAPASGTTSDGSYQAALGSVAPGASGVVHYQLRLDAGYTASELDAAVRIAYAPASGPPTTEALGAAAVAVRSVTLQVPTELGVTQTTAQGRAPAGSTVSVYDGAALLGQTTVGAGAYWSLPITLPVGGTPSYEVLHAEADVSGTAVVSPPTSVHYDPLLPHLERVCMHQTDGRLVCVVPDQGVAKFPYVWVPGMPFTFDVTFDHPSGVYGVSVALGGHPYNAQDMRADATLGSDGVFHATLLPQDGWSGIYVAYHVRADAQMLNQAVPTTPQQLQQSLPPDWRGIQITNVQHAGPNAQGQVQESLSVVLPDGSAHFDVGAAVTPGVHLALTPDQQAVMNQSGWPIYALPPSGSILRDGSTAHLRFLVPAGATAMTATPRTAAGPELLALPSGVAADVWDVVDETIHTVVTSKAAGTAYNRVSTVESTIQGSLDNWDGESNIGKLNSLYDLLNSEGGTYLTPSQFNDFMNQFQNMQTILMEQTALDSVITAVGYVPGETLLGNLGWGQAFNAFQNALQYDGVATSTLNALRDALTAEIEANMKGQRLAQLHPHGTKVASPTPIEDPSGYAYEAVPSNRVSGATATILQQGQGGGFSPWDAAGFGQQNPQVTDPQGRYGWDVPDGNYQVAFSAPGYRQATSSVVTVPPPQYNVNVALVSQSPPAVASVTAAPDGGTVDVGFTQYVLASTLTDTTVTMATYDGGSVVGSVAPLGAVADGHGDLVTLAARFTPGSPLTHALRYVVTTSALVRNYAGNPMAATDVRNFTVPIAPPTPQVAAVNPSVGSAGTTVTISGSGFTGATAVSFGGTPATTFAVASDGRIVATAPATGGTVDVTVTAPGGMSAKSPNDTFTYASTTTMAAPAVESLSVTQGPAAGGTPVVITGTGFTGATGVDFGPNPAPWFHRNPDGTIAALSPAGSGSVMVSVTTPEGSSPGALGARYQYLTTVAAPVLASGGQVSTADGAGVFMFPAGGVPTGDTVTLQELSTGQINGDSPLPGGAVVAGASVRLSVGGSDSLPQTAATPLSGTITLAFDPAQVPTEDAVSIYSFVNGTWSPLATTFTGSQASADVTRSADYAVLGVPAPTQAGGGAGANGAGTNDAGTNGAGTNGAGTNGAGTNDAGTNGVGTNGTTPTVANALTVSALGGTLQTTDGAFSLTLPSGDLPPSQTLTLKESCPAPSGLPVNTAAAECVFTLMGGTLITPVPATFHYNASALGTLSPRRLSIYRQAADGTWSFVPSAVNALAGTVSANVDGPGRLVVLANTQVFPDVSGGYWATPEIDTVVAASVVNGFPDGTFRPDQPVNRAQFATMVTRTLELATANGATRFSDVPAGAWYAPYVAAAAQAGIAEGTAANRFDPSGVVTREQMAVMLTRALKLRGGSTVSFSDAAQVDTWANREISAATTAGLLNGFPDGSFQPQGDLTRAQAAKVLALAIQRKAPGAGAH